MKRAQLKLPSSLFAFFKNQLIRTALSFRSKRHARSIYHFLPQPFRKKLFFIFTRIVYQSNQKMESSRDIEILASEVMQALSSGNISANPSSFLFQRNQVLFSERPKYFIFQAINREATITSDFWDTLVGRSRPNESAKRAISLFLYLKLGMKNSDHIKELKPEDIHDLWNTIESNIVRTDKQPKLDAILRALVEMFNLDPNVISESLNLDLLLEKKNTYLISEVLKQIEDGCQLVISDYYRSGKDLQTILSALKAEAGEKIRIISSFDYDVTKSSSSKNLFSNLIDNGVIYSGSEWLHVGDNPWSDVAQARLRGAVPIRVYKSITTAWNNHQLDPRQMGLDITKRIGSGFGMDYLAKTFTIGYSLVTFAIEESLRKNNNLVVYLSREGELLEKIHQSLNGFLNDWGINSPSALHFPCSRASTFMAAYFEESPENALNRLSMQYPRMSLKTFFNSFGIEETQILSEFMASNSSHEGTPAELYNRLPKKIQNFLLDHCSQQKIAIREYLKNATQGHRNITMVDLGWRGSIQDSCQHILGNDYRLDGVYLGLRAPFMKDHRNFGSKKGMLFDETCGDEPSNLFDFVGPLERIFTLSNRSVVGYQRNSRGNISPIFSQESEHISDWRVKLHEEMGDEVMNKVVESWLAAGLFGEEMKESCEAVYKSLMKYPDALMASTWFDEQHSENFGAGNRVHYLNRVPSDAWKDPYNKSDVIDSLVYSRWPEGYSAWMKRFVS